MGDVAARSAGEGEARVLVHQALDQPRCQGVVVQSSAGSGWCRDAVHRRRQYVWSRAWEGGPSLTSPPELDVEYRYWAFVEGHPAHHSLPENAHAEAMDALTWSYTASDCLLPSSRHAVAPFEQGECQELMTLLRSLEGKSKTQSVVHTRIVSKILMRVAQWRQSNFRPHKPLPNDASKSSHVERRVPFRRTLFDFVVSVVCLGIPYIFMDRTSHRRLDEESNLRNAGPMLMIGACACLLAAILLSASVTFLSFPGLDDVARVSGFLTVLCSIASMAAWVISMFRYNTETERTVRFVGQEGMIVISKRSVVMSLPLVFLAYSIIAFVTGVTIYSFRGFSVTNSKIIVRHFDEYTKWTVLGTLGGFGGVLLTAALLTR
ncbi:hypothetical protein GLOTRDRAFT_69836 [Gloeophyllum trabeum ATCC 11539]|uniref:Uncharacterized protein n=1 Tax=Gloeophyllum trabeum (strain ATCC 11539 / FP-39264 / Madison 617) TaxID=670483 RepID=S7QI38_GLOTA|nr:uncharacterized protein GLOTRDRAFT_69836 [Gloeophyllum trabeum ATCC 11539]EPQ58857.1 hypothetical protein GLOTRDRAFT_69836 [Gloeophyllum trabeum ATCC 11539]